MNVQVGMKALGNRLVCLLALAIAFAGAASAQDLVSVNINGKTYSCSEGSAVPASNSKIYCRVDADQSTFCGAGALGFGNGDCHCAIWLEKMDLTTGVVSRLSLVTNANIPFDQCMKLSQAGPCSP